jgi:hypothetical protein
LKDESYRYRQSFDVKNIVFHKNYTPKGKYNDIALIELASPVKFTEEVFPACLEAAPTLFKETDELIITGFGMFDKSLFNLS